MRVIYVAGPFRGPDHWVIAQNIRRAEELALEVWKRGAVAICPHANTMHFQGACPDEVWLEGDLELLRRCDAILMTRDWERSEGARAEHATAARLGMPILYTVAGLEAYLNRPEPSARASVC